MLEFSNETRAHIEGLCRRFQVKRLALFGSAVTPEFDATRSDVDLLVEFIPLSPEAHAGAFFALQQELATLLQRQVDLIEPAAIRNPYVRRTIATNQRTVYAA